MTTMNDKGVIFKSRFPVSPVYINALALFNGKSLPTFVNHTIISKSSDLKSYFELRAIQIVSR